MNKKLLIITIIFGLVISVGAIIYIITSKKDAGDVDVASEQVTNSDRLKTQQQLTEFNQKWEAFIDDPANGFDEYLQYALGEGARYECSTVIMDKVGREKLYGCDLNVAFIIHDFPKYISPTLIPPTDSRLNAVLDELITQSGMLQVAEDEGLTVLDSTFFNAPNKNYTKRLEVLSEVRPVVEDKFIKKIDFEMVVIYFHDQYPPANISIEQAKLAAKAKIDLLYQRMQSGEITMKQAGEEIRANNIKGDTTGVNMADLDPLYKSNAYLEITGHYFMDRAFIDDTYEEELRSLGEGQMSTVRVFKDYDFSTAPEDQSYYFNGTEELPMIESGYMIFKLNKIDFGVGEKYNVEDHEQLESEIVDEYKENAEITL